MKVYANKKGDSGVLAYEVGRDFIRLRFRDSDKIYTYSNESAGMQNVTSMKRLAESGKGLSTFVTRNVRDKFEK
ncbi:MAG: hypothetical protein EOO50_01900 [Flavobacterium sp.]|uniref:hypothetical protein n=1 Tax=Flavobacterium sp. TaxID=239 RepID=UPI0012145B9D|nr:hypothetical protein [Flavobacterium sp.]RZJ68195.1 MAG: hypothetical protein EOO50_01900 [Flavobacterium sp.]